MTFSQTVLASLMANGIFLGFIYAMLFMNRPGHRGYAIWALVMASVFLILTALTASSSPLVERILG